MLKFTSLPILAGAATLMAAGLLAAPPAEADLFNLTSCHLSGGCGTATQFGTVTLTQSGANVNFDVVLNSGNRFVETGSGGGALFIFNDTQSGTAVTNATSTLNGVATSLAVSGLTNQAPFQADGTGTNWTASVFCTTSSDCNGGSTPNINDLEFTVTNATVASLEGLNNGGNRFVADILCGQTGCTGMTGPVDNNTPAVVPAPMIGHGLLVLAVGGVLFGGKLVENLKKRQSLAA